MVNNRFYFIAAIPVVVILVVLAAFAYNFARSERSEQNWVVHTYQAIDEARIVLADVKDVELGQRSFLLTHQETRLGSYYRGAAAAPKDIRAFAAMTRDNPVEQANARALKQVVGRRFGDIRKSMATMRRMPVASPDVQAFLASGSAELATVRDIITRIFDEEHRLLDRRQIATRRYENRMTTTALIAAVVAVIVLLFGAFWLMRYNRRLVVSEGKLARQTSVLQATLESIRDGVAVFDTGGTLTAFNKQFFTCMNFPGTLAYAGAPLRAFEDYAKLNNMPLFEKMVSHGEVADLRLEHMSLGEREIDVYRNSVPAEGFLLACMDVSDRLRTERALRQAQKMEAVGHLTGGVAHDFNNLLQVVSANLDLTVNEVRGNAKAAERVQNAIAAVNRGSRLTGQLLAFARRQTLDPRSTNLGRIAQDMTALLRRTLGEETEIECVVAAGLWNTLVDPNQLENTVLNLSINARDAMHGAGKLTLEVANTFLDDAYAAAHEEVTAGQYVMLAVTDTGDGMPPEVAARAFEPFFTTKGEGEGTGLGLSQVYGFVKQSGGHIKIYSEAQQGTTVKLYLPRTRKPEEGLAPLSTTPVEGGHETVLVVEDDEGVRTAVVDMLSELGYSVLKAANAEQALTVLSSGAPVDILFTDVVMPGQIPTRELARRAAELHPRIAVLFTSGYTQNAIVHNGQLDEGVYLLSKPYRKDELAAKLRMVIAARRGAPAQEAKVSGESPEPGESGQPKKILVVEDVALIRMTTVDMLSELGITCVEAADGRAALTALAANPDIDLVLTDLGLPGMTGEQLMGEIRKTHPNLRIVIASGYSTQRSDAKPDDNTGFLIKPFDMTQLRKAIDLS